MLYTINHSKNDSHLDVVKLLLNLDLGIDFLTRLNFVKHISMNPQILDSIIPYTLNQLFTLYTSKTELLFKLHEIKHLYGETYEFPSDESCLFVKNNDINSFDLNEHLLKIKYLEITRINPTTIHRDHWNMEYDPVIYDNNYWYTRTELSRLKTCPYTRCSFSEINVRYKYDKTEPRNK